MYIITVDFALGVARRDSLFLARQTYHFQMSSIFTDLLELDPSKSVNIADITV